MANQAAQGFNPSSFMMQNTIVNAATKFIQTGVWWIDMVLLIFVMSFVASILQSFPNFMSELKSWISAQCKMIKNKIIKTQEIILKDKVYYNAKSLRSWRPEYRNNVHLVGAFEYYLNNQKTINSIKGDLDSDGTGDNEYVRMKNHTLYYSSLDPVAILDNGVSIFCEKTQEAAKGDNLLTTTTITIRTRKSHEFLKNFVEKIYNEYVDKYYKKHDKGEQIHYLPF